MICICLVAWSLCSSAVYAASIPASGGPPAATHGSAAAADFSNNLAMVNQNVYNGVTALANPFFKFAIDTAPNLAHLYAIFNGASVPPSLAAWAKSLYGNLAVGGGKAAGGAAVLGSSVVGSSMKLGGHGLQATNNILEAAGKAGIDLAGKLGDYAASGAALGSNFAAAGLTTAGDGMLAGSAGANVITQGISQVIDAISAKLVSGISSVEKTASRLLDSGVKVMANGALQFENKAQERVYNALISYVQIWTHVQNLLNLYTSAISGVAKAASVVSAAPAPAGAAVHA